MEAIKKKMQALKIEKDNAMDRAEAAENQLRDSNLRVEKVEKNFLKIFNSFFKRNFKEFLKKKANFDKIIIHLSLFLFLFF
jgi:predicted  nucleic acid-binding Zn-ribbon protein